VQLVTRLLWRQVYPWQALTLVLCGFVIALGAVGIDQFILWPMIAGPLDIVYSRFGSGDQAAIVRSTATWMVLSLGLLAFYIVRLRTTARSRDEAGITLGRSIRYAAALYSVVVVLSVIPNTALGIALFKLVDLAHEHRTTTLLIFNLVSGGVAAVVSFALLIVELRQRRMR